MINIYNDAKEQIRSLIENAILNAQKKESLPDKGIPVFTVESPADRSHGDFAVNTALAGAKLYSMPPRKIAEAVCEEIAFENSYFERAEIAGPGFINFFLSHKYYQDTISAVLSEKENYGRTTYGENKKVMVEFVSANPTGPMHIGNARGGALGDCLAAVLDASGYNVTREFYINDAGNQIDKFGLSLDVRYRQIYLGEDDIELPEDSYHGEDIKTRAQEFANIYGDSFLNKPENERRRALIDFALPKNIKGLKDDLGKYRIFYDVWFLESELHKNGLVKKVIDILTEKGLTYTRDGAVWYKAGEFTNKYSNKKNGSEEKDEVLIRANGNPTYFAADIAYHYNKFAIRKFDKVINVWGADHHGHVARLKGAMDAVGLNAGKLDIVLMQLVKLVRNGEIVKVSKRTGKSITLSDLLLEVPIDAARLFFNLREPESHLDFDLGLAASQTAKNPVYYVQYAHARICSILKALKTENIEIPTEPVNTELLTAPEEKELIYFMSKLPSEIIESGKSYDPARITKYLIELATLFHKYYGAYRIKNDDTKLMAARISLILSVKTLLKNILGMFKLDCPESM